MKDGEKNHIDEWLQKQIKKGIVIIDKVLNNNVKEWELYYTGHLQKDILCNFPGRTSKKIFKGYRSHLDNDNLVFTKKKFEEHGYEYYVKRGI
jgi:hypothetical protein